MATLEQHSEPRLHVRWHVDALVEGRDLYHGFIKDISLKGTAIFLEQNLQKAKSIKLHIHVPPVAKNTQPRIMEVSGRVVYTSYDSNEGYFHVGVSFTGFKSSSDQEYLQARIEAFNRAK